MTIPESTRRVFLGWDEPSLQRAARWLLEEHGPDLQGVIVALPGARAGRRLEELLVAGAGAALQPPQITTAEHLTDRLVQSERPAAGRMARTLVWAAVLAEAGAEELRPLVREPPPRADLPGWAALAETLRTLHAALAADDRSFEDVAAAVAEQPGGREAERWRALALLQRRYLERVAALGLSDPHAARRDAVAQDRLVPDWRSLRIVLVGVVDQSRLLARLLDRVGERVTALIFAPPERAADFDARGGVLPERWRHADIPLPLERWRVVNGPSDQASLAAELIAGWGGRLALDEIAVGVPDGDVAPYVERRLAELGVPSRHAASRRLAQAAPCRALAAAAEFLQGRRFDAFASLVRHPDVHALLLREAPGADPLALLDAYQAEHLPELVGPAWLDGRTPTAPLRAAERAVREALGELGVARPRPLSSWAEAVRDFLAALYAGPPLDRDADELHDRIAAFEALAELLGEIEDLPDALGRTPTSAADALALLLRSTADRLLPPSGREPAIELLGWLELPLDDAPGLVITGFNDGRLPDSVRAEAFLPQGLRRRLGLTDDELRVARDVYSLTLVLHSRPQTRLITARRSVRNDPLLPSRFAFHVPAEQAVERVRRWLPADDEQSSHGAGAPQVATPRVPPRPPVATPTVLNVTAFRQYLRCPYLFYLQNLLRLQTVDDAMREMDPLAFGTLAHAVLEAFGRHALRDARDAAPIAEFLGTALDRELAARYGLQPLPAVRLQGEQLRHRFVHFAAWQARHRSEGWRIARVEWKPATPASLDVDGTPMGLRGTIDRVDVHEVTGQWAILDYKTSEGEADKRGPRATHGPRKKDGRWSDLQLPLYALIARPLRDELAAEGVRLTGEPELGYVVLPHEAAAADLLPAAWTADELAAAHEAAREVVRAIRRGEFGDVDGFPDREPVLAAIAGLGLLGAAGDDDGAPAEGGP